MGAWQAVTAPTPGSVSSSTLFGIPVADNMADSGWVVPGSFTNSWTNQANVAYRLIGNQLRLRGQLGGPGTANNAAFTLPSGFRPQTACSFAISASGVAFNLVVDTTGTVRPTASAALSIDGITFLVD